MSQVRAVRIVQFLLGCVLITGSVVMLQFSVRVCDVGLRPSRAVQTYQQRVRTTQVLLKTDRLVLSSR